MTPEVLEGERSYLTGIAYRLLGSRADAEDVVQEALSRGSTITDARTPRALLTTIVTRLCLDELRSARRRREEYVGPWLPEPVLTGPPRDDERLERTESLSFGFLLLLEALSPPERAVFVLREVFDLEFAEIAEALDKSEAACRQLLRRAREHLAARRRRFPRPEQQSALAARFFGALAQGDVDAMVTVLVDEAESVSDHGGKATAARKIVRGAVRVAKLLAGLARKGVAFEPRSVPAWINGNPGMLVYVGGELFSAIVLDTTIIAGEPRIAAVHLVRNPDKLAAIGTLS